MTSGGMSRKELGVGLIGYGAMGKAHAYAHTVAPAMRELPVKPRLRIISGRHRDLVESAAHRLGVDEATTEWRSVVDHPDVDVVDICTPPGTHAEIVEAAARAGKAVICEKPLSVSLAAARAAVAAVESAGVLNTIGFNYRHLPAVSLMRDMVAAGEIGDVLLWRGQWLSDEFLDPHIPFDWRFDPLMGGSTIADLGSHLIDLAHWMIGPVERVTAQSATFTRQRAGAGSESERGSVPVTVDEASSALMVFSGGARGTFEVSRTCARRPCDFTLEVNGTAGTLRFDYARLNELTFGQVSDPERLYGMRTIRAEHVTHPYAADWWAIGQGVGYGASFVNYFADLYQAWPTGPWVHGLREGLEVQRVCDAMERSAATGAWVDVGAA
jgi:predicted dehydrogenase